MVVNVGPPPRPPVDGRPPRTPWPLIALIVALLAIGLLWWFMAQSQRQNGMAATATATAVAQATAQADAANQQAASQQTAAATQTAAQANAAAQAASVAVATATAQVAAEARAAQAVAAQATAAAQPAAPEPTPVPPPPATPVVIVVTATPARAAVPPPPPAAPAVAAAAAPPVLSAPVPPAPQPAEPAGQQSSRTNSQAPAPGPASPVAAPAASPAAGPPTAAPASVTVAAGQPMQLRYLGDRVMLSAEPDALPAGLTLTLRPVEAGTVPQPPGPIVDAIIFRLEVRSSDGAALPAPVGVQVMYAQNAVPAAERSRITLGALDGQTWAPLPDQEAEPTTGRIATELSRAGVYALYRQP